MNSLAFAVRRHVMAESNLRLLQSSIRKNNPKAPIFLSNESRSLPFSVEVHWEMFFSAWFVKCFVVDAFFFHKNHRLWRCTLKFKPTGVCLIKKRCLSARGNLLQFSRKVYSGFIRRYWVVIEVFINLYLQPPLEDKKVEGISR